jgi:putative redox protein
MEKLNCSINFDSMPTIKTQYLGELRTRAIHQHSGKEIITDAPTDNQGRGEAFSPTDLLAASLGSCMLTIMGIAANNHGFSIEGTHMEITKVMASDPRRVAEVIVDFHLPLIIYTDKQKLILEKAAKTCPVALSLHPDLKQSITFNFLS